ncbi:MAG: DUF4292 domain-containing protein [Gemmatimonadota bacterium]|nr:MAG: DUF4292 domain-containing protein [Gemmatimonadota bacterium]
MRRGRQRRALFAGSRQRFQTFAVCGGVLLLLLGQCTPFFLRPPLTLDATPEQIIESISDNVDKLIDLEGKVQIRLYAPATRETAVAKLAYRKPDLLKVEVKGFLGVTVANVSVRGDTIWVYYPLSNYLVQGRPTAENFELMTGIRLDIGDLESVILGEAGLARDALDSLVDFHVEGREYVLTFRGDGGGHTHRVEPRRLMVTRSDFFDDQGHLEMRYDYMHYEKFDGLRLPTKIEIHKGTEDHRVLLTLEEGRVNRGISEDRFHMNVPENVERIELSN